MRAVLVVLLPSLVAAVTFMAWTQLLFSQPRPTKSVEGRPQPPAREVDCVPSEPDRTTCVAFSSEAGASVYGWPSKGGVYTLFDCSGVELEFLGFDRLNPPKLRAGSQDEEDAHCDRMRQLGATWWKNEIGTDLFRREIEGPKLTDEYLRVGWPAGGGVWVLRTTIEVAAEKGAGLIHNAYNMEERCKVIEQMGGVFYADPKDCPYLDLP